MSTTVTNKLEIILANSYILYLKTQNYHWNVRGANFMSLHLLFQDQYTDLASAIDEIAERIVTLGSHAIGSYKAFSKLAKIKEVDDSEYLNSNAMLQDLISSQEVLVVLLKEVIAVATEQKDDATIDLCAERIAKHEKNIWMLTSSIHK
ncbi:DNA protection during starvation protein [Candidatus Hepatincola sp. Av]